MRIRIQAKGRWTGVWHLTPGIAGGVFSGEVRADDPLYIHICISLSVRLYQDFPPISSATFITKDRDVSYKVKHPKV